MLRRAIATDIPAIQRVRASVRENRLGSIVISDDDVRRVLEETGRGWVVETEGEVVAFAIGNATNGNVWALFVHPDHERRGHGRQLLDTAVSWLSLQRVDKLWLTTGPGTRAEKFYRAAGWSDVGRTTKGEV